MNGIWRCGCGGASAVGSGFTTGFVRGYDVDTVYFLKSFYTYIKLGNNSESSVNIKSMHFVLRHTTSQYVLPESLVSENPTSHAV